MRNVERHGRGFALFLAVLAVAAARPAFGAGKIEMFLPLNRDAYQTNETIPLAIVRTAGEAMPAGDLGVTVTGDDGSVMKFTLRVPAVPVAGKNAATTEHVYLNARLMRPGHYKVAVAAGGASAEIELDLFSGIRRTSYRLIPWGRAKGKQQLCEGEDSMGFNLFYGVYAGDKEGNLIRAGLDFMRCCTMGGGHQMDLRQECDWSDPYVTRGGTVRVVRQALADRTKGNTIGVHFYDEPGLTWRKDPKTGQMTPHNLPSQVRSYESAFGEKPIDWKKVNPKAPQDVARWEHLARWKLGFMDAAWRAAQFGVRYVRPDFLSVTQSQYGWTAFTDGYYFNVARCLPIVSGHGGYHDYGLMLFNPSYMLEFARARDRAKPCWYLPCWYATTTAEQFRLEQYLSFQTGIQGLQCPPDLDPFEPAKRPGTEGIVESNKIAARLGTIFNTMGVTRPPVAVLYSLSHILHAQTRDRTLNYAHADDHVRGLQYAYLASKIMQRQFLPVLDEDVADGTLSAHHKAVILCNVNYVAPEVLEGLESFAADGGLVLLAGKCGLKLKGAVDLNIRPTLGDQAIVDKLTKAQKWEELRPYVTLGKLLGAAKPLAGAIKARLDKAGIAPIFACDHMGIVATRQRAGDIEYLFAVNAAHDWKGPSLNTQAAVATIGLADDGRPIYDAVHGGKAAGFGKNNARMQGTFRFGPGQMRVFARTARPIGSVRAATPIVRRDYTVSDAPLTVEIGAVLLGADGGLLSGSAPLRVRVIDPLGAVRYDLYRATRLGSLRLALPLGVNDPAGKWKVVVRELLADTTSTATFDLGAVRRCGAVAGRKDRAIHFGRDRGNIFRFFRVHRRVTIVPGKSAYNHPAAQRLAKILVPWGVKSTIVKADDINKPRKIPDDAAATWVGLGFGRVDPKKPHIGHVGFAVEGAVILLGSPEDNPVIAYLRKERFLPYAPKAGLMPGRGRGLIAWQRDAVGHGQESVALIAHDAKGMAEAVGTMYEAMAGMEPLTALTLPKANSIAAATKAELLPEPEIAWQALLPDRAVGMKVDGRGLTVLTRDESVTTLGADGKAGAPKPLTADAYAKAAREFSPADIKAAAARIEKVGPIPGRIIKYVSARGGMTAVGYWGGLVRVLDGQGKARAAHQFQHDITAAAWLGNTLVVGLSDGRVVGLTVR